MNNQISILKKTLKALRREPKVDIYRIERFKNQLQGEINERVLWKN